MIRPVRLAPVHPAKGASRARVVVDVMPKPEISTPRGRLSGSLAGSASRVSRGPAGEALRARARGRTAPDGPVHRWRQRCSPNRSSDYDVRVLSTMKPRSDRVVSSPSLSLDDVARSAPSASPALSQCPLRRPRPARRRCGRAALRVSYGDYLPLVPLPFRALMTLVWSSGNAHAGAASATASISCWSHCCRVR